MVFHVQYLYMTLYMNTPVTRKVLDLSLTACVVTAGCHPRSIVTWTPPLIIPECQPEFQSRSSMGDLV